MAKVHALDNKVPIIDDGYTLMTDYHLVAATSLAMQITCGNYSVSNVTVVYEIFNYHISATYIRGRNIVLLCKSLGSNPLKLAQAYECDLYVSVTYTVDINNQPQPAAFVSLYHHSV